MTTSIVSVNSLSRIYKALYSEFLIYPNTHTAHLVTYLYITHGIFFLSTIKTHWTDQEHIGVNFLGKDTSISAGAGDWTFPLADCWSTVKWFQFYPGGTFLWTSPLQVKKATRKKQVIHSFYPQTTMVNYCDAAECTRSKAKKLHFYPFMVDMTWVKRLKDLNTEKMESTDLAWEEGRIGEECRHDETNSSP